MADYLPAATGGSSETKESVSKPVVQREADDTMPMSDDDNTLTNNGIDNVEDNDEDNEHHHSDSNDEESGSAVYCPDDVANSYITVLDQDTSYVLSASPADPHHPLGGQRTSFDNNIVLNGIGNATFISSPVEDQPLNVDDVTSVDVVDNNGQEPPPAKTLFSSTNEQLKYALYIRNML